VAFTPTSPWPNLAPDFGTTRAAFLGHYGAFDDQASPHTAYQLELKLREAGVDATFETYRRVGSEFYRMSDDHDPEVAALAWSRTVAFLRRVL
jgi:dienelactone hydrolase